MLHTDVQISRPFWSLQVETLDIKTREGRTSCSLRTDVSMVTRCQCSLSVDALRWNFRRSWSIVRCPARFRTAHQDADGRLTWKKVVLRRPKQRKRKTRIFKRSPATPSFTQRAA